MVSISVYGSPCRTIPAISPPTSHLAFILPCSVSDIPLATQREYSPDPIPYWPFHTTPAIGPTSAAPILLSHPSHFTVVTNICPPLLPLSAAGFSGAGDRRKRECASSVHAGGETNTASCERRAGCACGN
jgi:hypothetical protein